MISIVKKYKLGGEYTSLNTLAKLQAPTYNRAKTAGSSLGALLYNLSFGYSSVGILGLKREEVVVS